MTQRFALILLLYITAIQCGTGGTNLRASSTRPNYTASRHQRRELGFVDFWYTLLNTLQVTCPKDSTDDKPTGHCAHVSHHPSSHHKSGGSSHKTSGGGGGGGGSDDDGGNDAPESDDDDAAVADNPCTDDDGGNGCADAATWGDDAWGDDGHDDYGTNDGGTDDTEDGGYSAGTWDNGWFSNFDYHSAEKGDYSASDSGGRSHKGRAWGIALLAAGAVGAAAFLVARKRKRKGEESNRRGNDIPDDVYVQHDEQQQRQETATVKSSKSRLSIKSALSRRSIASKKSMSGKSFASSIKSKFSRSRSAKKSGLGTPLETTYEEDGYQEDETIATKEKNAGADPSDSP